MNVGIYMLLLYAAELFVCVCLLAKLYLFKSEWYNRSENCNFVKVIKRIVLT